MISIQQVEPKTRLLDEVIELADKNKATLGFFRPAAFSDYASKRVFLPPLMKMAHLLVTCFIGMCNEIVMQELLNFVLL